MRTLYAGFYGAPMSWLWPLRTKMNDFDRDRRIEKDCEYSGEIAQAEDAAERESSVAQKRAYTIKHRAFGPTGFYSARKDLVYNICCSKASVGLWVYNITLDLFFYPPVMMRTRIVLGMFGVRELFTSYAIKVDEEEALSRARSFGLYMACTFNNVEVGAVHNALM